MLSYWEQIWFDLIHWHYIRKTWVLAVLYCYTMENEERDPDQAKPSTTVTEPDAYGGYAPKVQTAIQRFNSKRSSTRNEPKVDISHNRIQRSLQDCKVNNNLTKLQSLMKSSSGTLFKRKCNALITILETLLVPADYKVHIDDLCVKCEKVKGFYGLPRWAEYVYWCHRT